MSGVESPPMLLYNTQSDSIEPLSIDDESVGIYVCGITPYDTTHAGHAFTFLTFDIIVRHLRNQGKNVTYVQNVTDIDDDILRKADELGVSWIDLGARETTKFQRDMQYFNALDPDHYVKATDHIPEMIEIIDDLIDEDLAYEREGNVYFSVDKDPDFGKLSKIPRAEMLPIANERGNTPDDPLKQDPLDFVLWQSAKPGEPTWESPWSDGRPGWHIECSAMATRYLGPSLSIHGGGADLVFPHHECEIAQSENATGVEPFAHHWVHVGMVEYQGEKMSKSLGNLVLLSDLALAYSPDAFRLYAFSHHYRSAWEWFDDEHIEWATIASEIAAARVLKSDPAGRKLDGSSRRDAAFNALNNDLDTPAAIKELKALSEEIVQEAGNKDVREAQDALAEVGSVLGLKLAK